jgi:hypothetical protein
MALLREAPDTVRRAGASAFLEREIGVLLARARRDLLLIGKRDAGEQYQTQPSEVTNVHGALLAAKGLRQSPGRSQRKVSDLSRYGREARWWTRRAADW